MKKRRLRRQQSSTQRSAEKIFGRKKIRLKNSPSVSPKAEARGGFGGAPPGPSVVGSIGSIIRSVRSIIVQPTSVDRSGRWHDEERLDDNLLRLLRVRKYENETSVGPSTWLTDGGDD